jgi:hypothetical protein
LKARCVTRSTYIDGEELPAAWSVNVWLHTPAEPATDGADWAGQRRVFQNVHPPAGNVRAGGIGVKCSDGL